MGTLMRRWWTDDPADPDVTSAGDPAVRRLLRTIAPGSAVTDLGGCFSLNLHLHDLGQVLRVQQPFVSRDRVLAMREVRRRLVAHGLLAAEPVRWYDRELLTCRGRWAELEAFVPHVKPEATWESYRWMYRAMGELHRGLRDVNATLPRPMVATYAPPSSLRRWLSVTESAVRDDPGALEVTASLRRMLAKLRAQWVSASALPNQVVHGDVRLGNVGLTPNGESVYLDFGFAAHRPRVYDLAYSLAWVILRPDSSGSGETFDWSVLPSLLGEYEDGARTRLTPLERRALGPYVATVPMYHSALAGYDPDPIAKLRDETGFLRIASWLLDNPEAART